VHIYILFYILLSYFSLIWIWHCTALYIAIMLNTCLYYIGTVFCWINRIFHLIYFGRFFFYLFTTHFTRSRYINIVIVQDRNRSIYTIILNRTRLDVNCSVLYYAFVIIKNQMNSFCEIIKTLWRIKMFRFLASLFYFPLYYAQHSDSHLYLNSSD